ncbi:ABC transporter ATP-binding protein [Paenibacillus yanchengensis]|uniref:ABC transporter ATP-binding protein n=1 Tax=Paenibacillus yanchengensis TaxID=2035833 RepID=A0ABW4YIA3_9BACL
MGEVLVQLQNVTKKISGKTIIDQLTLDVPKGEVFGFLGPNGSGKTTTIRMMVGLMKLSAGEILIDGHSIKTNFEQAIRQVGAIVENPEMYKYLTGYQNLLHYARMIPGVTKARIEEVIELVGMRSRIQDKVSTYSLGMRQRLGVAQAILHRPKLLILDEPTNGLDPAGIRELRSYLRQLCKEEGTSVFVSSHLLSEMELMCDRVAIIQKGKLIDIRNIQKEFTKAASQLMTIETNDPERAVQLIKQAGIEAHSNEANQVVAVGGKDARAELNELLVVAGLKVYSVREQVKTLEDQYLEVTGGESID